MKKHQNIFTGDLVEVVSTETTEGRALVTYEKLTNKQTNEAGNVIYLQTKPEYVFTATYKEVRV